MPPISIARELKKHGVAGVDGLTAKQIRAVLESEKTRDDADISGISRLQMLFASVGADWVASKESLAALKYEPQKRGNVAFKHENEAVAKKNPRGATVGFVDRKELDLRLEVERELSIAEKNARQGILFEGSLMVAKKKMAEHPKLASDEKLTARVEKVEQTGYAKLIEKELRNAAVNARKGEPFEGSLALATSANEEAKKLGVGVTNFDERVLEIQIRGYQNIIEKDLELIKDYITDGLSYDGALLEAQQANKEAKKLGIGVDLAARIKEIERDIAAERKR